ncbi:cystathionine gamma-synthase isoform 2, partial [Genlisea aurea]
MASVIASFECRSDPEFCRSEIPPKCGGFSGRSGSAVLGGGMSRGLSSRILKFPPNFVRQLSIKARRNCSNIGVAQVVAASWSNNLGAPGSASMANAVDAASAASSAPVEIEAGVEVGAVEAQDPRLNGENVQRQDPNPLNYISSLKTDGSIAIHAGERYGRAVITDAITTPIVNTSAYFFKKTADLIDFK